MGREQDLERQMAECRKAKEALIAKTGECMGLPDNAKAKMWNAVAPFIKSAVEAKIKDGTWPESSEFRNLIYDKVMLSMLGEGYNDLLVKL